VGEALLTTAFGLLIAVMAHIAHHFLAGRVRALVHDMEYTGHALIQFLNYPEDDNPLAGTAKGSGVDPED
jgi:biopolymer transport protein ExbB